MLAEFDQRAQVVGSQLEARLIGVAEAVLVEDDGGVGEVVGHEGPHALTVMTGAPACMRPTMAAAVAKPCAWKRASTSSAHSGAIEASRPPLVCVGHDPAQPVGDGVGEGDVGAETGQVAGDRARADALLGEADGVRQQGQLAGVDEGAELRASAQFKQMAEQAEAGDVGQRMHAVEGSGSSAPMALSWVVVSSNCR